MTVRAATTSARSYAPSLREVVEFRGQPAGPATAREVGRPRPTTPTRRQTCRRRRRRSGGRRRRLRRGRARRRRCRKRRGRGWARCRRQGRRGGSWRRRAGAAGLANPTTFRAWLSDGLEPITKRIAPFEGPYVRPDGVQIADHWEDLTDGTLDAPISIDETKKDHTEFATSVWTNIAADGGLDGYVSCDGWTQSGFGTSGRIGRLNTTAATWTHDGQAVCILQAHLYCVEG